jgi:hypothetical protein
MSQNAYTIKYLIYIIIANFLFVFLASNLHSNDTSIKRTLYIYSGSQKIGVVKENLDFGMETICFTKEIVYFSREKLNLYFTISKNFSFYEGKILRNGKDYIYLKKNKLEIIKKEKLKSHFIKGKVIPSCILHIFIHELIKNNKPIPTEILVLYENTGDTLNVKIDTKKKGECFKITFSFDKLNLYIQETYYPDLRIYNMKSRSLLFIDKAFKNNDIKKLNSKIKGKNIVPVPPLFSGFSNLEALIYKLNVFPNCNIQEDRRQSLIHLKVKNSEDICHLKVKKTTSPVPKEVKGKADKKGLYGLYINSFYNLPVIKKLSLKLCEKIKNNYDKVKLTLNWIDRNIKRDNIELYEPFLVLKEKRGDCQGISNLFLAMCSSLNIPGRAAVGVIIQEFKKGIFKYAFHQWTEIKLDGQWIFIDPTFNTWGIGLNYIKFFNLEKQIDLLKLISYIEKLKINIIREEK